MKACNSNTSFYRAISLIKSSGSSAFFHAQSVGFMSMTDLAFKQYQEL